MPGHRYEIAGFGVLFLAATFFFGGSALQPTIRQWLAWYEFVPVLATVVRADIESSGGTVGSGSSSWRPAVTYRYAFGSTQYEQSRIFYMGRDWPDREAAADWLTGYLPGTTVTAFVDPTAPHEAVLDNSSPDTHLGRHLLPFLLFGFAMFIVGFRRRRS